MLNDARATAQTLDRKAQDNAAARERDAAHKYTEVIDSTDHEKRILDELRTYHHDYRTRLKTYLQSQLHELHERGSAQQIPRPAWTPPSSVRTSHPKATVSTPQHTRLLVPAPC
jgi:hypothetical protein